MGVYDEDILGAAEDITEFGQLVDWFRPNKQAPSGGPEWEEATDEPDPTEWEDIPIAFLPMSRLGYESLAPVLGTEIPSGHVMGLVPGNVAFVPAMTDYIMRGSNRLEVVKMDKLQVNDQPVLYWVMFKE